MIEEIHMAPEIDANADATPILLTRGRKWKIARFNAARRRDLEELGVFVIFT